MLIDLHTHIFPPDIRKDRARFFEGESAFALLYRSPKSKMAGAAELVAEMDAQGIAKSVVFGFPWHRSTHFKAHNDYIIQAVKRYPDRLIGWACFDANHGEAAEETERCLAGGLTGVGELGYYESGIDPNCLDNLAPVMAICRQHDLPVMIHTNEPIGHPYPGKTPITLGQIYRLADRFRANRIVLAHWGGGIAFFHLLRKTVKEVLANVYFDTAASPYLYDPQIYSIAIQILGEGKIMLGSDYPLLPPQRYVQDMRQSGLSPAQIASLCRTNAENFLGLRATSGRIA